MHKKIIIEVDLNTKSKTGMKTMTDTLSRAMFAWKDFHFIKAPRTRQINFVIKETKVK